MLCQVCEGTATSDAENAKDECDRNIRMETCPPEMDHPVCAAFSERGSFKRLCLPKEQYKLFAEECDKGEGLSQCEMAMCEQSGCEASGTNRSAFCKIIIMIIIMIIIIIIIIIIILIINNNNSIVLKSFR